MCAVKTPQHVCRGRLRVPCVRACVRVDMACAVHAGTWRHAITAVFAQNSLFTSVARSSNSSLQCNAHSPTASAAQPLWPTTRQPRSSADFRCLWRCAPEVERQEPLIEELDCTTLLLPTGAVELKAQQSDARGRVCARARASTRESVSESGFEGSYGCL